jgi:hypothetical protein
MDQTPKPPDDDSSVFFIGSVGLVSLAVCAPVTMPREKIASEVNAKNPTGIAGGWTVTERADLEDYDGPYPAPCPDEDGRRHYMVHC